MVVIRHLRMMAAPIITSGHMVIVFLLSVVSVMSQLRALNPYHLMLWLPEMQPKTTWINYAKVLAECQPLANKGNLDCQALLFNMYIFGHGVPENNEEAKKWALSSSALLIRWGGHGVDQDYAEAMNWFRKAA